MPFNGILPSHANLVGLQKQMTQGETTMYYILDDDTKGEEGIKKGACKFGRRRRRMGEQELKVSNFCIDKKKKKFF